jgi:hypothetical protein
MSNISQINGLNINAESASYATTAQNVLGSITSASYAATASLLLGSVVSASYAGTASILLGSVVSASYAATASYSTTLGATIAGASGDLRLLNSNGIAISTITGLTSSYALTASVLLGSVVSASYAATSSLSTTASYALVAQTLLGSVVSASYAATASLAPNYVLNSQTSSFVQNSQTSSFVLNSQTSSMTVLSSSFAITASYVTGSIYNNTNPALSASYAVSSSYALSASWAPSAGGGTPGGAVNEVQYNNGAGGFGGAANIEISTAGNLNLTATTDPATPPAGTLELYAKTISGRTVPKVKGPSGLDYPLQSALWQNAVYIWSTTGATAGLWINTAGAGAGTFTAQNPTTSGGTAYTIQKLSLIHISEPTRPCH